MKTSVATTPSTIQAGNKIITAADPLRDDALHALTRLRAVAAAH